MQPRLYSRQLGFDAKAPGMARMAAAESDAVVNCAAMADAALCEARRQDALAANVEVPVSLRQGVPRRTASRSRTCRPMRSTARMTSGVELDEDSPCAPVNFLGETKLMADRLLLSGRPAGCSSSGRPCCSAPGGRPGSSGMAADALKARWASALPGQPVRRPHVSAAGLRRHPGVAHRWPAGRALLREERNRRRRLPVPVRRRELHREGNPGPGGSLSRAAAKGSRGSSETRSSASAGSSARWPPQAGGAL